MKLSMLGTRVPVVLFTSIVHSSINKTCLVSTPSIYKEMFTHMPFKEWNIYSGQETSLYLTAALPLISNRVDLHPNMCVCV